MGLRSLFATPLAAAVLALPVAATPATTQNPTSGAAVSGSPSSSSSADAGSGVDAYAVRSVSDKQVSLVVAVRPAPAAPLASGAVTATSGGRNLSARSVPLLSDRSAIGVVVDASADGAAGLRAGGLSGVTGLLLQLPAGARTALITDHKPPNVLSPLTVGVSDDVQAITGLRSDGVRSTSDALTLALRQLPAWPAAQPVIVLYTAAADAGGEPAADLVARLKGAHAVLAVVTSNAQTDYWTSVATGSGGISVSVPADRTIGAFDTVADGLRARYQVTFDRPRTDAGPVDVTVTSDGRQYRFAVRVPAPEAAADSTTRPPAAPGTGDLWWIVVVVLAVLIAAGAAVATGTVRRRSRPAGQVRSPVSVPVGGTGRSPGPELEEVASSLLPRSRPEPASRPGPEPPEPLPMPVGTTTSGPMPRRSPTAIGGARRDPRLVPAEERVLAHRERAWSAQLPDVDPALLRWTAAAATLTGARTAEEAHTVLALAPALDGPEAADLRGRLIDWWSTGVPGPAVLNPVRAGRFGEDLVARALGSVEGADDVLDRLFRLPSDRQVGQALALLARAHPGHPRLAELTDEAVLRGLPELTDRAIAAFAAPGSDDASSRSDLPLALLRLLTPAVLARLTGDRPAGVTAACTELARLADDLGRPDQARSLRQTAGQVEPTTAEATNGNGSASEGTTSEGPAAEAARPAAAPAPAPTEQGEDPAAIEAGYRRRLEAAEELLRQEPDNPAHRREVAHAHAGLAELDQAAHRLALADAGYRRALGALEQLVAIEPNNREHRHALAAALTRLADLDAAAGWSAQAAAGYRRAAEIKKEIAALDRAQHTDQRPRDRAQ